MKEFIISSEQYERILNIFLIEWKYFKYLLNGDGLSFVELYYDYVEKIYNKEIPLSKIANKARVKQSINEYKKKLICLIKVLIDCLLHWYLFKQIQSKINK